MPAAREGCTQVSKRSNRSRCTAYKSIAAAASSGVAPRASGMSGNAFGPVAAERLPASGTPSATFFPPISIVAPLSFAAVSLPGVSRSTAEREGKGAPGVDEPVRDGVCADIERAPLLRDRLREADDGGFGRGVVDLADVPVQAARGRHLQDASVLLRLLACTPSARCRMSGGGGRPLNRMYGAAARMSRNGARTWIFMMMSYASSGIVCSMRSYVKPAARHSALARLHQHSGTHRCSRCGSACRTFCGAVSTMREGTGRGHALDGRAEDLLGEVVRADVAADRDGVAASLDNLVDDGLRLLLVKAEQCSM
jgi:hypothetical protein